LRRFTATLEELINRSDGDVVARQLVTSLGVFLSGPLPPPDDFAAYERVLPGIADRMMRMNEQDQAARIVNSDRESRAESAGFKISVTGQALLPWLLVVATVVLVWQGQDIAGLVTIIVAALATAPSVVIRIKNAFNRSQPQDTSEEQRGS
jgi:uncharacterized membrane protein